MTGHVVARVGRLRFHYHRGKPTAHIIAPGALRDSIARLSSFDHSVVEGGADAGMGICRVEGRFLMFRGRFDLTTEQGRMGYEVVQGLGRECQWSFTLCILDSERPARGVRHVTRGTVLEVSPVITGAWRHSRTVALK